MLAGLGRGWRGWMVAGASALLLVLVPAMAFAAPPRTAREHLDAGLAHAEAGNWERALEEFEEAHHLDPQPATLFDVAQARQKLGRFKAAIEAYRALLAAKATLSPRQVDVATKGLATSEGKLARLTVRVVPEGSMDAVSVDDQPVVASPVVLDPGVHVVRGLKANKVVGEKRITLGAAANETITLEPAPVVREAAPPRIVAPPAEAERPRWPAWVAFGTGAALLGTGAVFAVKGYGEWSDLDETCGRTKSCADSDVDSARTHAAIGDVGIALGVLAVGVGVYWLVSTPGASAHPLARAARAPGVFAW